MDTYDELEQQLELLLDHFQSQDSSSAKAWQPNFWVAFSGGVDSSLLLFQLNQLLRAWFPQKESYSLNAIYINHGLQSAAKSWEQHCRDFCARLDVTFYTKSVSISQDDSSVEAAARVARYQAFEAIIPAEHIVVLGHHANDQTETVLFRMLRGTGVDGLKGMESLVKRGQLWLWRPFLQVTKQQVTNDALQLDLKWVEDPSNSDEQYSRNFLRQTVIPTMQQQWPKLDKTLGRLARHAQEATNLLDQLAVADLKEMPEHKSSCLDQGYLRTLSGERQKNLLRYSIKSCGYPVPQEKQMQQVIEQLILGDSSHACVSWHGGEIRMHQGKLYVLAPVPEFLTYEPQLWNGEQDLPIATVGQLRCHQLQEGCELEIRPRQGGEQFQPQGRAHKKLLRRWLQEWSVPNWLRDRIPLIYFKNELVAVAHWQSEQSCMWHSAAPESLTKAKIYWRPITESAPDSSA